MNILVKLAALAAALIVMPLQVQAGSRYGAKPALTVGADLSSPWVLQLKPKYRRATRRALAKAQRPRGLKRYNVSRAAITAPPTASSKYTRRIVHTASVRKRTAKLRKSITPNFNPNLLPTEVDYHGTDKPGTLVVNTPERRLYLVLKNGRARRYAIGVGKPGFEWAGIHKVSRKAEWPDWRPPAEMIARVKKKSGRILPAFMPGGPKNPLGARALYLGSTIYRIHGTNQTWSIGKAVSSGCIRMRNEDVMDLYDRVPKGTTVRVI
ncbi:MAG: L,D-transpeptidase [Hyphomicrobiales bacterium]|nr:MAG: L,D-transpeptidase [Hyphomicrobiales bacterium]